MLSKLKDFLAAFIPPGDSDPHPQHTLQLATAVLLIEIMQSDFESTDAEQAAVMRILKERFHLSDSEVLQLMKRGKQTAKAANDYYQFTSLINRKLTKPEKIQIIEYMWQVAYTDKHISAHENHLMRKIADLLYLSHREYISAKMRAKPADME